MNRNTKKLLCLGLPLAVGGLAALLTGGGMKAFASLNQPPRLRRDGCSRWYGRRCI